MAMYYYASKLNEASCSGCNVPFPPPPNEPPPPLPHHSSMTNESAMLHGSGLAYYDNDDYYSMVRGNQFMTEHNYRHPAMMGYASGQSAVPPQPVAILPPCVRSPISYPEKTEVEYKDGRLASATFETLTDMLRPGASKSFTFTFLLCSRLFARPHELLSKIAKRYLKNYDNVGTEPQEMLDMEVADMALLVKVLSQWTAMFPYDFREERVMALVRGITQKCAAEHMSSIRSEVSTMLERLLDKLTALEQYEEELVEVPPVPTTDLIPLGDILTLGLSPIEFATQLTLVELHRLSFVGPEEFMQTFGLGAQPGQSSSRRNMGLHNLDAKNTKNLEAYADWFNRLSYLVATDILKAVKGKYRARVLEQWVMTARECFNLGNFNSLMAIISALNMAPVSRLKKTWNRTSAVCGQQLRQLELCIEPSGNHARYRAALAAAPTETAVPLLSITCRDLHFANQVSPSKLPGNRVNFEKMSVLARHVSSHLASRNLLGDEPIIMPPSPHVNIAAWRFLKDRPTLAESSLEMVSFEREPPVDNVEKERLKRIRGAL